jgi:predicted acetyltransferase
VQLADPPRLVPPTAEVRESWLAGEQADRDLDGESTELLEQARHDFAGFVAARQGEPLMWGVPTSVLWYVSGQHYIGELVVRHRLTPALSRSGGHIGYGVSALWRRQGHAGHMLAAGLMVCRRLGLTNVLLTCAADNEASRRVILANGGVPDGRSGDELRFWIAVPGEGEDDSRR